MAGKQRKYQISEVDGDEVLGFVEVEGLEKAIQMVKSILEKPSSACTRGILIEPDNW